MSRQSRQARHSFIVRPHSQHANCPLFGKDFIDQAMLDIDSARAGTREISDELLVWRWVLKRISSEKLENFLRLWLQACRSEVLCVFQRVPGKDKLPSHQSSSLALLPSGSALPSLMDSRIPGTDNR